MEQQTTSRQVLGSAGTEADPRRWTLLGAAIPEGLQPLIVEALMPAVPTPATDIWCEDEQSQSVIVMRHGMQWRLNNSASALWLNLGQPVEDIVSQMSETFPDVEREEIAFWSVAFLLEAAQNGLVDFQET